MEQYTLESKYSDNLFKQYFEMFIFGSDLMEKIIIGGAAYEEWLSQEFSWEPKQERLSAWRKHMLETDTTGVSLIVELLTHIALKESCSIQGIAGMQLLGNSEVGKDNVTTTGEFLCLLAPLKLFEVTNPKMGSLRMISNAIKLPDELVKLKENIQFMPPVIEKVYVNPHNIGVRSDPRMVGFKRHKKTVFLNNNQHYNPVDLEVLEVLSNVEFSLDLNLTHLIDVEADPLKQKATARVKQDMLDAGNNFRFIHRYDARNRQYASGWQLNPQGNDYDKAQLSLARKEILNNAYNF
tara:strand:- start:16 stop:900 length:885 start_codon:yes stop_codon:yes gene_type:complete